MDAIELATTGRKTTRLGYGCSSIMGGLGRKQSLALLDAAFDAGIRHYDVAPLYGYGAAEKCLGEFLRRHAGEATVTTKYGIPPAKNRSMVGLARSIARPILRVVPGAKQRLARMAGAVTRNETKAAFSAAEAKASLERSLVELGVGRIDLWLLHDAQSEDLRDPGLLGFMNETVAAGVVGAFGVGTDASRIAKLRAERPDYCGVLQFEWSVLDALVDYPGSFRIQHRALTDNYRNLHAALCADAAACKRWSDEVGTDLAQKDTVAALMLKAALLMNPDGMVLFSSKSPANIQANVRASEDDSLGETVLRFYALAQREFSELSRSARGEERRTGP